MRYLILSLILLSLVACGKHKNYRFHRGFNHDLTGPTLLVVNGGGTSVSVIDLGTDEVNQTLQLNGAEFPHHIYLNGDQSKFTVSFVGADLSGGHAHGSSGGENQFQLFEAVTGKHIRNVKTEAPVHNAAFSPDDKEIWVGQAHSSTHSVIAIYSVKKGKLEDEITVGGGVSEVTFSVDGTKAYACNTSGNSVSVIDVASKTVVATLNTPADPIGAWPAPNGKMYVDCESGKAIVEIDVATNTISSQISLAFIPAYAQWNDVTDQLWVTDTENNGVQLFEKVNQVWSPVQFIPTGVNPHAIAFTSDYSAAYISNQGSGTVSKISTSTNAVVKTISVGELPNGMTIRN